jgi:hypothetical protein
MEIPQKVEMETESGLDMEWPSMKRMIKLNSGKVRAK